MRRTALRVGFIVAVVFFASACGESCKSGEPTDAAPVNRDCSRAVPTGLPYGLTPDKKVGVTVQEAWPNRPTEPPPLTPQQQADACALINACPVGDDNKPLPDSDLALRTQDCARGNLGNKQEERGIPQLGQNERFSFEARAVLAGPHDCVSIRAQATKRPPTIVCQEVGCWWESTPVPPSTTCPLPVPVVTCAGDIATLVSNGQTFARDCSRVFAKCDVKSSTGCAERPLVGCDSLGTDKCDGNVKLGCDGTGRVSFHDCARYPGGFCEDGANGVKCVNNLDKCPAQSELGCDPAAKGKLNVCVFGQTMSVDCVGLGMGACINGHCGPKT